MTNRRGACHHGNDNAALHDATAVHRALLCFSGDPLYQQNVK